jgi:ribosomal protein S8
MYFIISVKVKKAVLYTSMFKSNIKKKVQKVFKNEHFLGGIMRDDKRRTSTFIRK